MPVMSASQVGPSGVLNTMPKRSLGNGFRWWVILLWGILWTAPLKSVVAAFWWWFKPKSHDSVGGKLDSHGINNAELSVAEKAVEQIVSRVLRVELERCAVRLRSAGSFDQVCQIAISEVRECIQHVAFAALVTLQDDRPVSLKLSFNDTNPVELNMYDFHELSVQHKEDWAGSEYGWGYLSRESIRSMFEPQHAVAQYRCGWFHFLRANGNDRFAVLLCLTEDDTDEKESSHLSGDSVLGVIAMIELALEARYLDMLCRRRMEEDADKLKHLRVISEEKTRLELRDRNKTEFLGFIAHEIRNPLSAIVSMADLLAEEPLRSEQQEMVRTISSSGTGLVRLLGDMLEFSQIESGFLTLQTVDFSFQSVIDDVVDLVAGSLEKGRLVLDTFLDPTIPLRSIGDPTRVKQILFNLLSNAIKFTGPGGHIFFVAGTSSLIPVRVPFLDDPACHVMELPFPSSGPENDSIETVPIYFHVIDSGIGIEEGSMSVLFKKFAQADSSISRRFGGTGLGLAIVERLVRAHRGGILVRSVPAKGSCFSVMLKLAVQSGNEENNELGIQATPQASLRSLNDSADIGGDSAPVFVPNLRKGLVISLCDRQICTEASEYLCGGMGIRIKTVRTLGAAKEMLSAFSLSQKRLNDTFCMVSTPIGEFNWIALLIDMPTLCGQHPNIRRVDEFGELDISVKLTELFPPALLNGINRHLPVIKVFDHRERRGSSEETERVRSLVRPLRKRKLLAAVNDIAKRWVGVQPQMIDSTITITESNERVVLERSKPVDIPEASSPVVPKNLESVSETPNLPTTPTRLQAQPLTTSPGVKEEHFRRIAALDPFVVADTPILLVDDSAVNLRVLARMFQLLGLQNVGQASSGLQAISKLFGEDEGRLVFVDDGGMDQSDVRYQMVFMDVSMPDMDGLSATRAIRHRLERQKTGETDAEGFERHFHRPPWPWIVAFTASTSEAEKEDCMDSGMDDHVTKPATKEALVVAMERYADACRNWHQTSHGQE
ncbi:hypothetical protein BJ742DRAFT_465079 [Cladochytrium replicatum]|nr:hypothetical protein BJ742DRAFT_465079 [Cladochytrium replicatum]